MVIVFAIFGFVTGVSVGSGAVAFALSGRRQEFYWSLVNRHPISAQLARFSIIVSIIASGVTLAYLGFMLAE